MGERYKRLFSLPKNIYSAGSPVVIAAGALLLDNTNDKIIAQLKFKSISSKAIKSLQVSVLPLDSVNRILGEPVLHEYLDLAVNRDDEFGQKEAVFLPNPSTRAFSVTVVEVAFADNNVWTPEDDNWQPMPVPVTIDDKELLKQYQYRFGEDAKQLAVTVPGAWVCACGGINTDKENKCHKCGKKLGVLLACDMDELAAEKNKRLALERENRIRAEDEEREKRNRRRKKTKRTVSTILTLVFICAMLAGAVVLLRDNIFKKANQSSDVDTNSEINDGSEVLSRPDADEKGIALLDSLQEVNIGDIVTFGTYEQDHNAENGEEKIEWTVLDREEDNILLLSTYGLEEKPFDNITTRSNWPNCEMRAWLNGVFFKNAFSFEEQNYVKVVTLENDNLSHPTEDKVFLLSKSEVTKYFPDREKRKCGSAYLKAVHSRTHFNCVWWLRSPNKDLDRTMVVLAEGKVLEEGFNSGSSEYVRPAVWVKTKLDEDVQTNNPVNSEKPVPSANISNKPSYSSGSAGSSGSSYGSTSGTYYSKDRSKDAWVCAKMYVEDNLKSPSTAEFCKYTDATVMRVGEDEYIIHGYVDAQNSFGAIVRQTWTVSLFLTENGFKSPYLEWG